MHSGLVTRQQILIKQIIKKIITQGNTDNHIDSVIGHDIILQLVHDFFFVLHVCDWFDTHIFRLRKLTKVYFALNTYNLYILFIFRILVNNFLKFQNKYPFTLS